MDEFMKDYLWIIVVVIVIFTVFISKLLNTNIDPGEIEEHDENYNELNTKDTDED